MTLMLSLSAARSKSHVLPADQLVRPVLRVVSATLVVALGSHIAFPVPFTPVPLTLQPLAVLGVGLVLGQWEGAVAMLLYLLEGALGLPVFSPLGPGGLAQLVGPTAGFLLAYPLVAFVCGHLVNAFRFRVSSFAAAILSCTAAVLLLFLCGASWMALQFHLTVRQTFIEAVLPFLPGEAIKIFAAAGVYATFRTS